MTITSGAFAPQTPVPTSTGNALRSQTSAAKEDAKIDKSAKDFESILLGSWLQQAQHTFAELPGEDDGSDLDSGKDQYQSIAMQSLGTSMAAGGGIGIARMIANHLHKTDHDASPKAPEGPPIEDL